MQTNSYKLLCYGIGNASRGDDALGPLLLHWLQSQAFTDSFYEITFEEAFQLQPENIYDFDQQDLILFLDADARFQQGIHFANTKALRSDNAFVSHALAPDRLLSMHSELTTAATPTAYTLSMGAEDVSLKEGISDTANNNLTRAKELISKLLLSPPDQWHQFT